MHSSLYGMYSGQWKCISSQLRICVHKERDSLHSTSRYICRCTRGTHGVLIRYTKQASYNVYVRLDIACCPVTHETHMAGGSIPWPLSSQIHVKFPGPYQCTCAVLVSTAPAIYRYMAETVHAQIAESYHFYHLHHHFAASSTAECKKTKR